MCFTILQDKPWETWISLKDDLGWIDVNNRQSKSWLHSLSRFFGEIFQNYSNAQKSKRKSGLHILTTLINPFPILFQLILKSRYIFFFPSLPYVLDNI